MRDVEEGECERGLHRGDEFEKRNVVKRNVEGGRAMWSMREVERVYHVVVREKFLQSRKRVCDGKVGDTISSTVEELEVDKSAALFRESGYLIPHEDKLLQGSQPANVLWEFGDHIKGYIKIQKGRHLANDGRKMAEFIVGYVQCLEHPKAGEIPRKLFHAIILQFEHS